MKTFHRMRVLCALTAGLFSSGALGCRPVSAASSAQPAHGTIAANLARIVSADRAASRVQSVIFGAWKGNAALLTLAQGDSFSGMPATTDMHIRPGIVETEALATILVQLADAKRISLDAPLSKWLPALPRAKSVTLRMLGNQRSGYGDYLADAAFSKRLIDNPFQTFTADELIAVGMRQPMPFLPGTGFHYAHTNAVVLGTALERITGKPVATLIAERVAGPLHLTQTAIPVSADPQEPAQHVFYRDRGPYEDSTYWNPSWAINSGTIVSTIHDVAVMQRAFGDGALVSKAGLAELLAPTNAGNPPQSKNFYFGLGVIVGNTWVLQHAQVAGSDVVMGYLPSRDLTIVVSTAIGYSSSFPAPKGYSLPFFKDAARYLAPERPIPTQF